MQEKPNRVQSLMAVATGIFSSKNKKSDRFESLGIWKWSTAVFQLLN